MAEQNKNTEQKVTLTDPKKGDRIYEESIKTLRTNLQFSGRNIRNILFTSCYPNEGKSDVSFQLAREIGNMGKRVLLLDADIRKSTLVGRYRVKENNIFGLTHYLCGQVGWDAIFYQTNFPNMDIVFAGPSVPNPSELLEDEAFAQMLRKVREQYDYVLVDTPPLGSVSDSMIIARWCDGSILVIESEAVSYKAAQRAKQQLQQTGCKILGAVLNKVDMEKEAYYNRNIYYNYSKRKD